jgi:hypothetical protein
VQEETIVGYRLSPQQQRLWRLQQGCTAYCTQFGVDIRGKVSNSALQRALQQIVDRHGILRTGFRLLPGMELPLQIIFENRVQELEEVDLSPLKEVEQVQKLAGIMRQERAWGFDHGSGEILRTCLVTLSLERRVLIITLSALCADAESLKNLLTELFTTYHSDSENESQTSEPIQYIQFSEWQNELMESEDSGKEYWVSENQPLPSVLVLPFEAAVNSHSKFDPASLGVVIPAEWLAAIESWLVSQ